MLYRCNLCIHFTCETLRSLVCHLKRIHKNDPGFYALCGIDGCSRTYTNFYSLRNHFIRKHGALLTGEQEQQLVNYDDGNNDDGDEGNDDDMQDLQPFNFDREIKVNKRSNALCLMQMKDEGRITQTVVESVVRNTTQIVDNIVVISETGGIALNQCPERPSMSS